MKDSTIERYALAEQHRAPLRDIGKGYVPSDVIRITRYKAGQVVEIIERTVRQDRATERVLFKQSAAKRKVAAQATRDNEARAEAEYLNDERTDARSTRHYPSVESEDV